MRGPFFTYFREKDLHGFRTYGSQESYRTDFGAKKRKPLPYKKTICHLVRGKATKNGTYMKNAGTANIRQHLDYSWGRGGPPGHNIQAMHNACYAKFLEKVRQAPQIGTNIAEFKQTLDLIGNTARVIRRPFRTLATAVRDYARDPKFRGKKLLLRDMPNAWLAFHFGVEPLIKDMYDLCKRLADPGKPMLAVASKSQTLVYNQTSKGYTSQEVYKQHVRIAAHVTRTDDTLSLLNDCGLINPLSITWELVPFSFVVDWFYPVGLYINSLSDLLGYKIQDPYRTWYASAVGSETYSYPLLMASDDSNGIPLVFEGFRVDRQLVTPGPVSQSFHVPVKISVTRAATAISLLLQFIQLQPKR